MIFHFPSTAGFHHTRLAVRFRKNVLFLVIECQNIKSMFNLSVSCADSSSKALRFSNRPVLLSGQSLTDQKGPIRGH